MTHRPYRSMTRRDCPGCRRSLGSNQFHRLDSGERHTLCRACRRDEAAREEAKAAALRRPHTDVDLGFGRTLRVIPRPDHGRVLLCVGTPTPRYDGRGGAFLGDSVFSVPLAAVPGLREALAGVPDKHSGTV